jgi:hypothetical protein
MVLIVPYGETLLELLHEYRNVTHSSGELPAALLNIAFTPFIERPPNGFNPYPIPRIKNFTAPEKLPVRNLLNEGDSRQNVKVIRKDAVGEHLDTTEVRHLPHLFPQDLPGSNVQKHRPSYNSRDTMIHACLFF